MIRIADYQGERLFEPSDALARPQADLAFIEEQLVKPFAGPTVVVTLHGHTHLRVTSCRRHARN